MVGEERGEVDVAWYGLSVDETCLRLRSDLARGLAVSDIEAKRATYGRNVLVRKPPQSLARLLLHQFRSLLVLLLGVTALIAFALGDLLEGGAILIVLVLNAMLGFATEWKSVRAMSDLRKRTSESANVLRAGAYETIPVEDLVPGDVVLLEGGGRVPADGRVVSQTLLTIDESLLTGESLPRAKDVAAIDTASTALGDRTNMVYLGTLVTGGHARMLVTATGAQTEMGKIGGLLDDVAEHRTPLEVKLTGLTRVLIVAVLGLCGVIVFVGWLRGNDLFVMVKVGISLAIAAVPEGLVAVTTMTLAIGMKRMARVNALIRRLPAVEALGSTTVICSDKTGTLTRNEMTVRSFALAHEPKIEVSGTGYSSEGEFHVGARKVFVTDNASLELALRIGALCNDAKLERVGQKSTVLGDPTEVALLAVADKAGLDRASWHESFPRVTELPFSSEAKQMVTVHRTDQGRFVAYVKGAPAALLLASTSLLNGNNVVSLSDEERVRFRERNQELASSALRVLALAYRDLPDNYTEPDLARELTFVGLVGMIDPLRDEVRGTIDVCRAAGIRTVMITGDQEATAAEIARQLGIDEDPNGKALQAVHGSKLSGLSTDEWLNVVRDASVFVRVSPADKLQIVDAFQRLGHVVAMTGDGVNDAPALRKADIGIAMGMRGTEVAKDASAMILVDDNFATIVLAVEQGRIVLHNILRFIQYLFSCNFAEILTMFVAVMSGWPLPLGVLQILWLNLVTDIFPAFALALEPSAPDVMTRPPRDPKKPLMTWRFGWLVTWQGTLLGACTLASFALALSWYGKEEQGLVHAQTIAFMTLALAQTFHAFNVRSRTRSALTGQAFTNAWLWGAAALCLGLQILSVSVPFLRTVLATVPLSVADWQLVGAFSLAPIGVVELVKVGVRLTRNAATVPADNSLQP